MWTAGQILAKLFSILEIQALVDRSMYRYSIDKPCQKEWLDPFAEQRSCSKHRIERVLRKVQSDRHEPPQHEHVEQSWCADELRLHHWNDQGATLPACSMPERWHEIELIRWLQHRWCKESKKFHPSRMRRRCRIMNHRLNHQIGYLSSSGTFFPILKASIQYYLI